MSKPKSRRRAKRQPSKAERPKPQTIELSIDETFMHHIYQPSEPWGQPAWIVVANGDGISLDAFCTFLDHELIESKLATRH